MSAFRQALAGLTAAGLAVATVAGSVVLALAESGSPVDGGTAVALAGPSPTLAVEFPTPLDPTFTPSASTVPATSEPTPAPPEAEVSPTPTALDTPSPAPTPFQVLPTPCRPPSDWVPIRIQRGDTMFRIALQYGLTVPILQKSNCLPSTRIYAGDTLHVPGHVSTPVPCGPPPGWVFYTVERGDNLFRLSLRYGVTLRALQQANCLRDPAGIYAGQQLFVPPVGANAPTGTFTPTPPPTWTRTPVPTSILPADTPVPPTNTSAPPTSTPVPTQASTPTPSATPVVPTATGTASSTPSPTGTSTPTPTSTATNTEAPSPTPTATP